MILVESSHLIGSYLADLIRWDKSITNRIRIVWNSEKKIESQAVIYILIAFTTFAVTKDSFDRTAKSDQSGPKWTVQGDENGWSLVKLDVSLYQSGTVHFKSFDPSSFDLWTYGFWNCPLWAYWIGHSHQKPSNLGPLVKFMFERPSSFFPLGVHFESRLFTLDPTSRRPF